MPLNLNLIDPDSLYTTREASQLVHKSEAWFERHRWAGTGPAYSPGKPVTYLGSDLLYWLKAQRVGSTALVAA